MGVVIIRGWQCTLRGVREEVKMPSPEETLRLLFVAFWHGDFVVHLGVLCGCA